MLLSLTGICLVAGAILAGVNQFNRRPYSGSQSDRLGGSD